VIEAAGYATALPDALRLAAPGAHVLLLALGHATPEVPVRDIVERGLKLTGCNAFRTELPEAIALLAAEGWRYRPVVTDTVSLADAPEAIARQLRSPDAVKLLVRP
jgi:(R,R)-butanediol dehydrogenase/meso-butanediol dehydrogenase/diacetyl reductase